MLPGWFGSSGGWGFLPEVLDQERFSYVFTDYRGYGERRDEEGEYTLPEISSDVVSLLDDLGTETFSLVGHSMGGACVLRVLADVGERVRSLVGISPIAANGFPFDDDGWALFDGAAENDENRYGIIDFTTGNRLTPTWVNKTVAHSVEASTREAFGAYLTAWGRADFLNEVEGNETPIKVIVGEHDPAVGADLMAATYLEQFPNIEMDVQANAGHYPMWEVPVALATSIETFLAQH
ncbi:MAG: alpha/beta fold hydrolase [Acidimicrobiia bacterium]|nr:alpha/beta fold hydrolase [Acidimicrobiia bacterium]